MKTEKIYVDGVHEYNLIIEVVDKVEVYQLRYSDSADWSFPNKLVLMVEDHGNGIEVKSKLNRDLEYNQAHELHIVLSYIHKNHPNSGTIEVKNTYTL